MSLKVIRPSDIKDAAGISKSTAYRLMGQGKFPKIIKLTDKAVGWRASDIEKWLAERAKIKAAGKSGVTAPIRRRQKPQ